jgi:hypothetical protein
MMKKMMSKTQEDTAMAGDMCGKMCESKDMTERMLTKLHDKGILDDACFKKGVQKTKSLPETKENTSDKDEHTSHH